MDLLDAFEPARPGVEPAPRAATQDETPQRLGSTLEPHPGIPPLREPQRTPHRVILIAAASLFAALSATLVLARFRPGLAASATPAVADAPELSQTPLQMQTHVFVAPQIGIRKDGASMHPMLTPSPPPELPPLTMPILPATDSHAPVAITATAAVIDESSANPLMVDQPFTGGAHSDQSVAPAKATRHPNQSLSLAAGSIIGCALETALDSSRAGLVNCIVTDDVVSDDARTVLIERGSHVLGEYRSDARVGDTRIAIVWNRLRKGDGTLIDLASPAVDAQGRSGILGGVDNHWFSRIGAAVLLSIIEDGVASATTASQRSGTVVLSNTSNAGATLSEKVLDASINQAPTLSINAGARINILVARDIDFGQVYATR